jgi:hypothetical protein
MKVIVLFPGDGKMALSLHKSSPAFLNIFSTISGDRKLKFASSGLTDKEQVLLVSS